MKIDKHKLECAMLNAGYTRVTLQQATGIAFSTICRCGRGDTSPDTLLKLMKALNVRAEDILKEE